MKSKKDKLNLVEYEHKQESKLVVAQTNALTEATYKMSVGAKRLMFMLLAQVDQRKISPAGNLYKITAKDYALTCKINESVAYRQMALAADELRHTDIITKDDNRIHKKTLSHYAIYAEGAGYIEAAFNPLIVPYIHNFRRKFTQFRLAESVKFKRFYTIRLYELIMQFDDDCAKRKSDKAKYMIKTVDELKNIFQVNDKKTYDRFHEFNRHIIKPSLKEIELKTDLKITTQTFRTGRVITSIRFDFEREKQSDMFKN